MRACHACDPGSNPGQGVLFHNGGNLAAEELIDEVDKKGDIVATYPKSELKKRMFLHKAALIIPRTFDNKFLLGKRAKDKEPYADTLCCAVGGKISSGESAEKAAMREMHEEAGKEYPLEEVTSFVYDGDEYKAIFTIFTTKIPINPEDLRLDPRETQYLEALSIEEILDNVNKNPEKFAPTFVAAFEGFAKAVNKGINV